MADSEIGIYHITYKGVEESSINFLEFYGDFYDQLPEIHEIWYPRYVFYAYNGSHSLDDYTENDVIIKQADKPVNIL